MSPRAYAILVPLQVHYIAHLYLILQCGIIIAMINNCCLTAFTCKLLANFEALKNERNAMAVMVTDAQASLYLDKRRSKKDGTYPVKLYVWQISSKVGKYYSTGIGCSEKDFASAWETKRPRKEYKELRLELNLVLRKAEESIDGIVPFSFESFERKVTTPKGEAQNVFWQFEQVIANLTNAGRIGTAESNKYAHNAIREYCSSKSLQFASITPKWLQQFEDYMASRNRSMTTVGIYLRALRAIFNKAIEEGEITKDLYPFGKRKYVIPSGKRVKKALNKKQLSLLYYSQPSNEYQEKAKAFFFFSYSCNGMNMKDIALLRYDQLKEDSFTFYRAKTRRTTKENLTPITVYLNEFSRSVISNYGNTDDNKGYVFPILSEGDNPSDQQRKIQAFTRSVNQHLKKLAIQIGLPDGISTIWARHSFATGAVLQGHSMDFMREALGHTDQKTTLNYFAGFESEAKKELAKNLMNFQC